MKDACGGEAISSVKYFKPSSLYSLIKKAFLFFFTPFFHKTILFCTDKKVKEIFLIYKEI
jgi:hypothetical protein